MFVLVFFFFGCLFLYIMFTSYEAYLIVILWVIVLYTVV